jgi:hypothetical protein
MCSPPSGFGFLKIEVFASILAEAKTGFPDTIAYQVYRSALTSAGY